MMHNNHHLLVGREHEVEILHQLSQKICQVNIPAQICLVHGNSGSGKTALCDQLQQQLAVTTTS